MTTSDGAPEVWRVECEGGEVRSVEAWRQAWGSGLWRAFMPGPTTGDLGLEWWESNYRMCFQKGASILERTERDAPGSLAWAAEEEARLRATFTKGRRYLTIIERASRPMLPGLDVDPEGVVLPCSCTDRRPPRWRCICGTHRNRFERGHTLLCTLARDEARRDA